MNNTAIAALNREFLRVHPNDSSRVLERMPADEAAACLAEQSVVISSQVLEKLTPASAEAIIAHLPPSQLAQILGGMAVSNSINLLTRLDAERRKAILDELGGDLRTELESLLEYPENTAGRQMSPRVAVFKEATTVSEALRQMQVSKLQSVRKLYLVDADLKLQAQVDTHKLLFADADASLSSLSRPVTLFVRDLDHQDEVIEKMESSRNESVPVVNNDFQVVGIIEGRGLIDAMREDIALDIQTMVGASREERALSSALFAVRKRLPWLQINLVTAFLASAVVGLFEDTIARFTALAVLMPIAAGQSGNTGAQALAVTMRGLTLREVTVRDWFKIVRKEFASGLINGIAVALVCGLGVYLWSSSFGLALVMALAMIISMTVAGTSGAFVPILLQRFGMDPAQSSSIVLTTITDIVGFMSFLGIATILASLLEASL
ncbi:MAG: magnesium transporter [Pseudohongiellaceae bacterium]